MIVRRSNKNVFSMHSNDRTWTIILKIIFFRDRLFQPLIIFRDKQIQKNWIDEWFQSIYAVSSNEWIDNEIEFVWLKKNFHFQTVDLKNRKFFFNWWSWIVRFRAIYWILLRDWHHFSVFFVSYNSLFLVVECWLFWIIRQNIQKAIKWQKSIENRANHEIEFFDLFTSSKNWSHNDKKYNNDLNDNR